MIPDTSLFCHEEPGQFALVSDNVLLSSMNVSSMRKFCEFDDFVNENIRMSHRIYSREDFLSDHEPEPKIGIRIGIQYQAVIDDSNAMEEEFHVGVLVSSPLDDMVLSPSKRKADSQSLENSLDEDAGFCFEDSLRKPKKNCLAACFELSRSSGRDSYNYVDYSENFHGESAFQSFGNCENYFLTFV